MFRNKASAESCLREAGSSVIMTLLFDKLAGCTPACQITAKRVPPRRIVLTGVASTASITMDGLERPMKKQHASSLIPRDYKPLAKCVPGIAVKVSHFVAFARWPGSVKSGGKPP